MTCDGGPRTARSAGRGMTQSGGSLQCATGWALLGLAASGQRSGPAAIAYVRRGLGSLRAIGDVERTVLVVRAAGQDRAASAAAT